VAVAPLAERTLGYGVPTGTVVVPKKPITALKADILGITKKYGLKVPRIVFIANVVQGPGATEQVALAPNGFCSGAGPNHTRQ